MTASLVTLGADYTGWSSSPEKHIPNYLKSRMLKRVRAGAYRPRPVRKSARTPVSVCIPRRQFRAHNFNRFGYRHEHMDGLLDWGKSVVKSSFSPITSIAKGVGHATMETWRGVKSGDIGRVVAAPFRGIGHGGAEWYRDTTEHLEYYWRPSKMNQWMTPVGAVVTAAGSIPSPLSPFLLAGGAALTAGGMYARGYVNKDKAKKAAALAQAKALADAQLQKKKNVQWLGIAAAAVGGGFLLFS